MDSGETLKEMETADGSLLIRSNAISTEMMAEVDQQPLNLTGGRSLSVYTLFGPKKSCKC